MLFCYKSTRLGKLKTFTVVLVQSGNVTGVFTAVYHSAHVHLVRFVQLDE